jgi:hypothetical protein
MNIKASLLVALQWLRLLQVGRAIHMNNKVFRLIRKRSAPEETQALHNIQVDEVSVVPKAANRKRFILIKSCVLLGKRAVPYSDFPRADPDTSWDGNAAELRLRVWASSDGSGDKETIDWEKYQKGFLWVDSENPDSFSSYKMPVLDIINGEAHQVWHGITAAYGAMSGARGGVDVPTSDISEIKDRLQQHYEAFDKKLPEEKVFIEDEEQRLVTGIVMEPEKEDFHKDSFSADVIQKAAHEFLSMRTAQKIHASGTLHQKKSDASIDIVESFIVPQNMEFNGRSVKKGAWVITVKIHDDATWAKIKNRDLTGFSIYGTGFVRD